MKRKCALLVLICLFIGAASIQLSAQRTYQFWFEDVFYMDVYCDGDLIERVEGTLKAHLVYHTGQGTWQLFHITGTAIGSLNGEEFKYIENDRKDYFLDPWVVKVHYNLKGNLGSHYIGTAWVDLTDLSDIKFEPIHTVCN